jgi:hypothetical protein
LRICHDRTPQRTKLGRRDPDDYVGNFKVNDDLSVNFNNSDGSNDSNIVFALDEVNSLKRPKGRFLFISRTLSREAASLMI